MNQNRKKNHRAYDGIQSVYPSCDLYRAFSSFSYRSYANLVYFYDDACHLDYVLYCACGGETCETFYLWDLSPDDSLSFFLMALCKSNQSDYILYIISTHVIHCCHEVHFECTHLFIGGTDIVSEGQLYSYDLLRYVCTVRTTHTPQTLGRIGRNCVLFGGGYSLNDNKKKKIKIPVHGDIQRKTLFNLQCDHL